MKIERLEGNTEVTYQDHGTVIAVFIKGDTEEDVNERFWSFWNHGATSGEFHWVEGENNGYFWTTPDKLKLSLERAAFHKLLNDNPDWEKVAVCLRQALSQQNKEGTEEFSCSRGWDAST